jgi:hypothetical protein
MYDEKSDIFSFAVILWRLFGSRAQYEPQHANGVAENGKKTDKGAPSSLNDEDDEEFDFLKVDGKHVPPPKQRELIRKVLSISFPPSPHFPIAELLRQRGV